MGKTYTVRVLAYTFPLPTRKGLVQLRAGVEVQWREQPWSSQGVRCDVTTGLCNFTHSSMAVGENLLQARAVDVATGLAGDPQS